jgi:predicted acylesterase/phospholipase RssA
LSDEDDFFDRDALLAGRARGRPGHLLFLLESWPGATESGVLDFLASIPLFAGLGVENLRDLLGELEPVDLRAGDALIRAGDAVDFLAIVAHGRLRIGQTATERGPGQVVGEAALLAAAPSPADVVAVRDSLVLRLSPSSFERFGGRHPAVLLQLCRQLVTAPPPRPSFARSIAVVGLTPNAGADLAGELATALTSYAPAIRVTKDDVDRDLGAGASEITTDDPRNGAVLAWLQRVEQDHPFVVFDVHAGPGPWTDRCVRQADLVLLVADARGRPPRLQVVQSLARRELVLLHDAVTVRPSGTAAWLSAFPVAAHHHLRAKDPAGIARLARAVAGRSVGVVLSGGGARGAAHLGVLRALDEEGVPVDAVGGASIGALVASFYAAGFDHDTRVAKVLNGFHRSEVLRPTLPVVSMSSSARTTRRLARELEGTRIEDCWTPFFCVSANISRAELVVHDRGEAWRAVRASISLPGIFPPVFQEGDLLVDGGVLDNLPVDVMRQRLPAARVLGVELFRAVDLRVERRFEPTVSGWRALVGRLGIPSPATVLMRSSELQSVRVRREVLADADVLLRPPVGGYSLLDFDSVRPLVDSSYRWAKQELERTGLAERLRDPPAR